MSLLSNQVNSLRLSTSSEMLSIEKILPLQEQLKAWRSQGQRIALVPTMGNLHEGHLSLVSKAQEIADRTVVSVFVNPAQFVEGEDYATYPRTLEDDSSKLEALGTDILFYPDVKEIYPEELKPHIRIVVPDLDSIFCGLSRPGHFAGVATVVTKLFNIVMPDVAVFGEKDYQQLLLIKKLVQDLFLPVEITGMPTVREKDGLAMSSRNAYLNKEERDNAGKLYQTLQQTAAAINAGESDFPKLEKEAKTGLDQTGFKTEYFAIRDAMTLKEPGNEDLVVLAAAHLGKARLIDNVIIRR